MAEVNANSLPAKTDLGTNDSAIVVDQTTNAGALVDLDVLADKVLDRITSKTFANHVGGSSAATLLAQLATLNSNMTVQTTTITSEYFSADIRVTTIGRICEIVCTGNYVGEDSMVTITDSAIPPSMSAIMHDFVSANDTAARIRVQVSNSSHAITIYRYGTARPIPVRMAIVYITK